MKENMTHLVYGLPVILGDSEQLKPLGLKKLGKAFQDSLQVGEHRRVIVTGAKTCKQCRDVKNHNGFRYSVSTKDGLRGKCKVCESATEKARYARNKTNIN